MENFAKAMVMLVAPIIAILITITVAIQVINGKPVPDFLVAVLISILSYYFGVFTPKDRLLNNQNEG